MGGYRTPELRGPVDSFTILASATLRLTSDIRPHDPSRPSPRIRPVCAGRRGRGQGPADAIPALVR